MTLIKNNKIVLVFYVMAMVFTYALILRVGNLENNNIYADADNTDVVLITPESR